MSYCFICAEPAPCEEHKPINAMSSSKNVFEDNLQFRECIRAMAQALEDIDSGTDSREFASRRAHQSLSENASAIRKAKGE